MAIYKRGRPRRYRVGRDSIDDLPNKAGEYRLRNSDGGFVYVGETVDIRRRLKEHKRSGRFRNEDVAYIDYMVADPDSKSSKRREHERKSIRKHRPKLNRSRGGEGRVPFEDAAGLEEPRKSKRRLPGLLKIVLVLLVLALLAMAASSLGILCF